MFEANAQVSREPACCLLAPVVVQGPPHQGVLLDQCLRLRLRPWLRLQLFAVFSLQPLPVANGQVVGTLVRPGASGAPAPPDARQPPRFVP